MTRSEYIKAYRLRNLVHLKARRKAYYYEHRRESIQKTLNWQQKNIEERRAYWRAYRKTRRKKDAHKIRARQKVRYHVKMGHIIEKPCQECGHKKVYGHHSDYSKPLDVIWLCRYHHDSLHNSLRQSKLKGNNPLLLSTVG